MKKYNYAIVVGATSGIGRELVRQLAASGTKVAALGRRQELLSELETEFPGIVYGFGVDVTKFDGAEEKLTEICHKLGGLELFIYNSGVMPAVEPNEFSLEKDTSMIDVNITGAVAWLNAAAGRMQNTKHGTLIGIGSVAGDRGRQGQPVYNASKAFLHTYLEALRNRMASHGVNVVTIKPGPVDTELITHLNFKNAMSASVAATKTLNFAHRNGEFYLKPIHKLIFYVIKRIPSLIFRKLPI
jgi:decaprenylphospho-beta-D-erythro-pentofuranosid-2-ulose 2-reductase